ncbi:hypothetical protein SDC9_197641 [bioreactor metagenome]|uniref:Uncharacterized protein n=1 Tax=bioreactor metagenome TaxID=1076179 RepID=A0A645IGC6_9ZZZZ
MGLPRKVHIDIFGYRENTPYGTSIDESHHHGNSYKRNIFPKQTTEKQKEDKGKNQSACTHMIRAPAYQPREKTAQ